MNALENKLVLTKREARETGRDYALRTLKANIIRLRLEPGAVVSENELAAEMGLSRTPVREALIELSKVKIVEIYPQKGSAIALVDYALVEEARFMRETLECAALERCCDYGATNEQRETIAENLRNQNHHLCAADRSLRLFDLDNEFHRMLFGMARLETVYEWISSMTIHLDRMRTMHLIAAKENISVNEHEKIAQAIFERDAERAKTILRGHIRHYEQDDEVIRDQYLRYIKRADEKRPYGKEILT